MTRVLIVDDKPENLYLLRALLQGHGCEVNEAHHGAEALVKARLNPPLLVISDLLMPVMDGYTLLRHWKMDEQLKAIPFVVYTATYTEPKDEQLALDLGADAFILKPAEPQSFMARIHEVLAKGKRDELSPARAPESDEKVLLKEYSEVLIRKLEEKAFQLEQTNRALQEDIARRQRAEFEANQRLVETERSRAALLSILEDQRDAEVALRAKTDELDRYFTSSLDLLCIADTGGYFRRLNPEWERALGYPLAELEGRRFLDFVHPDDVQATVVALGHLSSQKPVHNFANRYRHKDGSYRWIEWRSYAAGSHIYAVARDITERKQAEEALREHAQQLQAVSRRLLEVQEDERRVLSRELHDDIGQVLTALKINLQVLERRPAAAPVAPEIEECAQIAGDALAQVRAIMLDLRPPQLDELGLVSAVHALAGRQLAPTGLVLHLSAPDAPPDLPPQIAIACYRIAQEALTNIVRHAAAKNVWIEVIADASALSLTVRDDGRGFDFAAARARATRGTSIGLLSMEERALLAGGRVEIITAPGTGTTVRAVFAS